MTITLRSTSAIALALLLVAGFSARDVRAEATPPSGLTILTGSEIKALFAGLSVDGIFDGKRYREDYKSGGRIIGEQRGYTYRGRWSVRGDLVCLDYDESSDSDGCWFVSREGRDLKYYNEDGSFSDAATIR